MTAESSAENSPSWDPLGYGAELRLSEVYYPLGFPIHLRTNSAEVLRAAEATWEGFRESFFEPPCNLRVIVSKDPVAEPPPAPRFRAHEHLLLLAADQLHFGVVDFEKRLVCCWVSESEVRRGEWFQYHYLEGACLALLNHLYLTPIHASCVADRGRGVLLCGKSGSGKSSLAYSCTRQSLAFVSDAATYLVREDDSATVTGNPRFLKLLPSAATLFPELKGRPVTTDLHGSPVLRLSMEQLEGTATATSCGVQHVIFLDRHAEQGAELAPIGPREALSRLVEELPRFSKAATQAQVRSLGRLVVKGAHVLRYGAPSAAVERVLGLLREARV